MAGNLGETVRISDKEAFRVLNLPLGVDKEAITKRYKSLSIKLSASRLQEDKKRLEMVIAAYRQLLPPIPKCSNRNKTRHKGHSKSVYEDYDSDEAGSDKDWRVLCRNGDSRCQLSQSVVDLTEEERERRKVEKRRAKRKKRKEKKKLEKIETQILNKGGEKREDESPSEEEEEEEEEGEGEEGQGIDPNSAFVANAAAKWGGGGVGGRLGERAPRTQSHPAPPRPQSREERMDQGEATPLPSACQLAKRGNEAANVGQYVAAIKLFSDAIALDQTDHRFLGNRSFCFNQLGYHERALQDAERAITLAPQWAKGHYRRGTALRDLGRFVDAEAAFKEVLRLDETCKEAYEEIKQIMISRIIEMGFTQGQAISAVAKYSTVQPALDALLSGEFREAIEDVFYSDDEDDFVKRAKMSRAGTKDAKMNLKGHSPQNPEGLTSLWVGNVVPEVTEKSLSQLFAKHGEVTSVRVLKDKYCAFVNFTTKTAAGRAMEALQGREFCGQKLLIKFPDNPIQPNGAPASAARRIRQHLNPVASKNTITPCNGATTTTTTSTTTTTTTTQEKLKGPVNGVECYFFRTSGCAFGDNCKHQHILKNRGIDRRSWQKQQ
ncbi:uncharacterized protein LOC135096524 isoform X2 [Scylla paramamosain]|uniref:uncharacterized protein LOC135096524 isoform X2 n=1 Tax=Scylla paramamosain TaxID=85552 RepID=UPI00308384A9